MKQPVFFRVLPVGCKFFPYDVAGEFTKLDDHRGGMGSMWFLFQATEVVDVDLPSLDNLIPAKPEEPMFCDFVDSRDGDIDYSGYEYAYMQHTQDLMEWWETTGRKFIEKELAWQQREKDLQLQAA
jgi:hypothetical protein